MKRRANVSVEFLLEFHVRKSRGYLLTYLRVGESEDATMHGMRATFENNARNVSCIFMHTEEFIFFPRA